MYGKISTVNPIPNHLTLNLKDSKNSIQFGIDGRLRLVISILKFFGNCPLTRHEKNKGHFYLNYQNPSTIWCFCSACFFGVVLVIFMVEVGLGFRLLWPGTKCVSFKISNDTFNF